MNFTHRIPAGIAAGVAALVLTAGCATPALMPTGPDPSTAVATTSATDPSPSAGPATTTAAAVVAPAPPAPVVPAAPHTTAEVPGGDTGNCAADEYRNSSGHCVPRPTQAAGAPAGASALCNDGTYSFSEHRRGTCSHHEGVQTWLKDLPA